ncbi:MAG: Fic family protein [Candidatus Symbiobacter sp.]|nr:Fic family protein [Candidatus Symbiobacter sp.]
MTERKIIHVWPPETGIVGISVEDLHNSFPVEIDAINNDLALLNQKIANNPVYQRFNDELRREWSVYTGLIEGIYQFDRGVTTTLIEHGFDKRYIPHGISDIPASEIVDVLTDHKSVLDGLYDFIKSERELTTSYIKELHAALTRNQETADGRDSHGNKIRVPLLRGEWKKLPNNPLSSDGITEYRYCPPEQAASEMDKLIEFYNTLKATRNPITLACFMHHRITQIHPFQDGNGRVARALASLVLIKAELFPFTVTTDTRADYLSALEYADNDPSINGLMPLTQFFLNRILLDFSKIMEISQKLDAQNAVVNFKEIIDKSDRSKEYSTRFYKFFKPLSSLFNEVFNEFISQNYQQKMAIHFGVVNTIMVEDQRFCTNIPFTILTNRVEYSFKLMISHDIYKKTGIYIIHCDSATDRMNTTQIYSVLNTRPLLSEKIFSFIEAEDVTLVKGRFKSWLQVIFSMIIKKSLEDIINGNLHESYSFDFIENAKTDDSGETK